MFGRDECWNRSGLVCKLRPRFWLTAGFQPLSKSANSFLEADFWRVAKDAAGFGEVGVGEDHFAGGGGDKLHPDGFSQGASQGVHHFVNAHGM